MDRTPRFVEILFLAALVIGAVAILLRDPACFSQSAWRRRWLLRQSFSGDGGRGWRPPGHGCLRERDNAALDHRRIHY
jgi:hypothetical protein